MQFLCQLKHCRVSLVQSILDFVELFFQTLLLLLLFVVLLHDFLESLSLQVEHPHLLLLTCLLGDLFFHLLILFV